MHLIIDLFKNSDILSFFTTLASIVFSIYTFKNSIKKKFERERYDNLIFPLFNLIEPYLFKEKNNEIFEQALLIIEKNKSIAGGKYLNILYLSKESNTQKNFNKLCRLTNLEVDRISKILGLKRRCISYRLNREQYKTKLMLFLYIVCNCFVLLISFFMFLTLFVSVNIVISSLLP